MQATTLTGMASKLLAAVVADLTNPPARQIVAHGPRLFALDCEMVTVSVSAGRFDNFGVDQSPCLVIPEFTFEALWVRCYPKLGDDIPTAASITEASQVLNADLAAVASGILDRWRAQTLFDGIADHCDQVTLGQISAVGPEGGFAGYRMLVTARL